MPSSDELHLRPAQVGVPADLHAHRQPDEVRRQHAPQRRDEGAGHERAEHLRVLEVPQHLHQPDDGPDDADGRRVAAHLREEPGRHQIVATGAPRSRGRAPGGSAPPGRRRSPARGRGAGTGPRPRVPGSPAASMPSLRARVASSTSCATSAACWRRPLRGERHPEPRAEPAHVGRGRPGDGGAEGGAEDEEQGRQQDDRQRARALQQHRDDQRPRAPGPCRRTVPGPPVSPRRRPEIAPAGARGCGLSPSRLRALRSMRIAGRRSAISATPP